MTEKELIDGVIRGNREALTCLVDKYRHSVIKTAYYYLGNMADAEDLAQEIFLDVVSGMKRFRQKSSLSTWIYRITVNRSLNALKKKQRRASLIRPESLLRMRSGSTGQLAAADPAEDPAADEEHRMALRAALAALPERQRTAFILSKYEDLPGRQVAEIMGLSLSSVESLMFRARKNLQQRLIAHYTGNSKKSR